MKEIFSKTINLGIALIVLSPILLIPSKSFAQTTTSTNQQLAMAIDPAIIELIVDKSETGTKEVTVYNTSSVALPIKAIVQGFNPGESVDIQKKDLQMYDASSWIKMDSKDRDFILQPKAYKQVKINVVVPERASPGGHYATIYFNPLIPQTLISDSSVFIYARIAVLVFIQVKGDFNEKLTLDSLKTDYFHQTLPVIMDFNVKNTGDSHVRPTGKIGITDEINRNFIGETNIPLQVVLPGTIKEYKVDISKNLEPGFYSADLTINYGTFTNVTVKSNRIYFFVLPSITTYIYIIIGIVILFILFKIRIRLSLMLKVLFANHSNVPMELTPKKLTPEEEMKRIVQDEFKRNKKVKK